MQAQNFKFLNKAPLILGFELLDCAYSVAVSMFIFVITSNHFFALVVGFLIVLSKSAYKKLYPKNTLFFWRNKKDGVATKHFLKMKEQK